MFIPGSPKEMSKWASLEQKTRSVDRSVAKYDDGNSGIFVESDDV